MKAWRVATIRACVAVLIAALVTACVSDDRRDASIYKVDTPSDEARLAFERRAADDLATTAVIQQHFAQDGRLSTLDLHVATAQGLVMLRGNTPDTETRNRAGAVARLVTSGGKVKNHINVQVPGG